MDAPFNMDNALAIANAAQTPERALAELAGRARSDQDLDRVAFEFEAMAISEMLKPMFAELKADGPFGGGPGEEAFRGMLYQEYAAEIAKAGGVGIASQVKAALIRAQENSTLQTSALGASPDAVARTYADRTR